MTDERDGPIVGEVEIHGLRCLRAAAPQPGEEDETGPLLVDIHVRTDMTLAARTDLLEHALDISALAAAVREVVAGPPRTLLERVALDVASALLRLFPSVEQARVRVRKAEPRGLDAAEEAVMLSLQRSSSLRAK